MKLSLHKGVKTFFVSFALTTIFQIDIVRLSFTISIQKYSLGFFHMTVFRLAHCAISGFMNTTYSCQKDVKIFNRTMQWSNKRSGCLHILPLSL